MAQEKFAVQLSAEDRTQLEGLIRRGQRSARVINRARILLKTDEGWSASQVAAALDTSPRTVFRTKRRYAEEGLDGVLHDHPQANRYRKLDDQAARPILIALACSDSARWPRLLDPASLLADKSGGVGVGGDPCPIRDGAVEAQKNVLQPWRKQQWLYRPKVRGECGGPRIGYGAGYGGRAGLVC